MNMSWQFVEKYYPNYDSCDTIALADDLSKIINNEHLEKDSDAYKLLNETYGGNRKKAISAYNSVHVEIYEKAMQAFMEQQQPIIINVVWGKDNSYIAENYGVSENNVSTYSFNTTDELKAFKLGSDEAMGWDGELTFPEDEKDKYILKHLPSIDMYINIHTGNMYRQDINDSDEIDELGETSIYESTDGDWIRSLPDEEFMIILSALAEEYKSKSKEEIAELIEAGELADHRPE